ncbi:MAG: class I SAM-dependent methyltransferase [Candidatus Electryonea clarkiae]|nr:class I SAM-dependent methyltransferase [Candidatus Electryonea clarkiae]MDP8286947.1 class I SAM-dependent methyltransferase [Candidatus Electryonea clarkiae]
MSSRFIIQPDHPLYIRAAKREAKTWGRASAQVTRSKRPRDHPLVKKYLSGLITDKANDNDWVTWFMEQVGPFNSALSLGSGTGRVEEKMLRSGLFKRLEVVDISGSAVEEFQHRLSDSGIGTAVSSRIADLNFIELPRKSYDFILAHTSLHHIINLEHLLEEVRRALVPGGLFLVYDFIGPSGWQWSYETLEEVNRALELSRGRFPNLGINLTKIPDHKQVKALSPFEAVRSGELLELINHGFEPRLEVLTDRLLHIILHYGANMSDWDNPDLNKWLQEMIEWEDSLKQGGEIPPYTLWGAYYPGSKPLPLPQRLTEKEIQQKIGVSRFFPKGLMLDLMDKMPFREKLIWRWMHFKHKYGKY